MTKETMLRKIHSKRIVNYEKVFLQNPSIIESAYELADQYSQLIAIQFNEWSWENGWVRCYYDGKYHGYYQPDNINKSGDLDEYSISHVFQKFLESKNK